MFSKFKAGHCEQNYEALTLFPLGKWTKCFSEEQVNVSALHLKNRLEIDLPNDVIHRILV